MLTTSHQRSQQCGTYAVLGITGRQLHLTTDGDDEALAEPGTLIAPCVVAFRVLQALGIAGSAVGRIVTPEW